MEVTSGPWAARLVDAALIIWVVFWIGLGVAIGVEMHRLTDLSNTVTVDGRAIETVGSSLTTLAGLPFVGNAAAHAGEQARLAGQATVASGQSSRSAIGTLSVLLAIAVALLPSVPVLTLYIPWRLNRRSRAWAVRRAVRDELQRLRIADRPVPGRET